MTKDYIERRGEGYYFIGSRVSLDSVVYEFLRGESAESISREAFPSLSLEQVNGGIAFYLANRQQIDEYLEQARARFEALAKASEEADPAFYAKLRAAKRAMLSRP